MSEKTQLKIEIDKLSPQPGDILVIRRCANSKWDGDAMRRAIVDMLRTLPGVFVLYGICEGEGIELLTEAQMNQAGWYRKEKSSPN